MKTVWMTALGHEEASASLVSSTVTGYGLACKGHFWIDAPEKMAWKEALTELLKQRADLWLILANAAELAKPSVRYGLSLFAAALVAERGAAFPIVILDPGTGLVLPDRLVSATVLPLALATWPAKVVAKANMPANAPAAAEYRLNVLGNEQLGQWFEIGPNGAAWSGVVFGVCGEKAKINFQAVGPAGKLPEKATLEFAQEGLKLDVGGREFIAWAVRNSLDAATSYFARVEGCPEAILMMPYSDEDAAEATVLGLV